MSLQPLVVTVEGYDDNRNYCSTVLLHNFHMTPKKGAEQVSWDHSWQSLLQDDLDLTDRPTMLISLCAPGEDEWPRTKFPQPCGRSANESSASRYRPRTWPFSNAVLDLIFYVASAPAPVPHCMRPSMWGWSSKRGYGQNGPSSVITEVEVKSIRTR